MRTKFALLAVSVILGAATVAHGTPLVFNVSGNVTGTKATSPGLPDQGVLGGTVTFDSVTFNAIAANITVSGGY